MYNFDELFYEDEDYANKAKYCNDTQEYAIIPADKDSQGRQRYKFKKLEKEEISEEQQVLNDARIEYYTLTRWLDVDYARHDQKYNRLITLNLLDDDGTDPRDKLYNLYLEAETKRKRVQYLEELLKLV